MAEGGGELAELVGFLGDAKVRPALPTRPPAPTPPPPLLCALAGCGGSGWGKGADAGGVGGGLPAPRQAEVRKEAVRIVAGLTGDPVGLQQLAARAPELCPLLLRQLHAKAPETSKLALSALVNLCQDPRVVAALLGARGVEQAMEALQAMEPRRNPQFGVAASLVANLTQAEAGCAKFLQLGESFEGLFLTWLLRKLASVHPAAAGAADPAEHLGAVLTNLTRFPAGRRHVTGAEVLRALLALRRTGSGERRRCVYGALKNCCMEALRDDLLGRLLDPAAGLVAALMEPVSGRKAGEEGHEADAGAREAAAEALLALASTDVGFEALWAADAPKVLNNGYSIEEAPGVCDALERCAELFLSSGKVSEVSSGEGQGEGEGGEREVNCAFVPLGTALR